VTSERVHKSLGSLCKLAYPRAHRGSLVLTGNSRLYNKYVEGDSARPEVAKQVAEIDRGDGSVVYGGGRAERAASGRSYRLTAYGDGVAYVEVAAFVAIAVTS